MGLSDRRTSCQRPTPSPSAPADTPSPFSSALAVIVRALPGGSSTRTFSPGEAPASSTPRMVTVAVSSPGLINRSRLGCGESAGLKSATWRSPSVFRSLSCSAANTPPATRTWACTRISNAEVMTSRQSPSLGGPIPADSPFTALPSCRSSALSATARRAPMASTTGPCVRPPSSVASMNTSPLCSPRLAMRTTPCLPVVCARGRKGTQWRLPFAGLPFAGLPFAGEVAAADFVANGFCRAACVRGCAGESETVPSASNRACAAVRRSSYFARARRAASAAFVTLDIVGQGVGAGASSAPKTPAAQAQIAAASSAAHSGRRLHDMFVRGRDSPHSASGLIGFRPFASRINISYTRNGPQQRAGCVARRTVVSMRTGFEVAERRPRW